MLSCVDPTNFYPDTEAGKATGAWVKKKWAQFLWIYTCVNSRDKLVMNGKILTGSQFGEICRAYVNSLVAVSEDAVVGYSASVVTPYFHLLKEHLGEFCTNNRDRGLKAYSCSSTERQNLLDGRQIRRANSRRPATALVEVFMARMRLLLNNSVEKSQWECEYCATGFKKKFKSYVEHVERCATAAAIAAAAVPADPSSQATSIFLPPPPFPSTPCFSPLLIT